MTGKAPGKHYREGISLVDLIQKFPDAATAEAWFEENRWGEASGSRLIAQNAVTQRN